MQNPVTLGAQRSAYPVKGGITRLFWPLTSLPG
jgi:hypothetical protein